jgi:hypothetical protein
MIPETDLSDKGPPDTDEPGECREREKGKREKKESAEDRTSHR